MVPKPLGWVGVTRLVIVLNVLAIAGFDLAVLLLAGEKATISRVILTWASQYPVVPFVVGVVMGHLFWPQEKTR